MTQEHLTNFSRVETGCPGQGHLETDAVITTSAEGAHSPDSDIDLLVDYDTGTHGLFPLMRLCAALGELLGFNVDAVPADMLRPEILESALRDAVAL